MLIDFDSLGYVEHMFSPFFSHRDACVMHVQIYARVHAFKKVNLLDTYPYIFFRAFESIPGAYFDYKP